MGDWLSSWRDTAAKQAIVDFVSAVTDEMSPQFVPVPDRIATLDNDGTLWCERPTYIQFQHGVAAFVATAERDAALREVQPYKAAFEQDMAWFSEAFAAYSRGDHSGVAHILGALGGAFEGMTPAEFDAHALTFLSERMDPHFGIAYRELTYLPMVELVRYLQANEFQVWIVSGGGRDFMRSIVEDVYGIARHFTIGSSVVLKFDAEQQAVVRSAEIMQPIDDGPGKVINIAAIIGREPILVAGNSDGDIQMFQMAQNGSRPWLNLLVHHDDEDREYAYDSGAEKAVALAAEHGWTVVSMRNDFERVFAFEKG